MSGGKQTPRQKMIGMMYLVLTALLALNISKEIINSFMIIESGLISTTKGIDSKNGILYQQFELAVLNDEKKAKPFYLKATAIKEKADSLSVYIGKLKAELRARIQYSESPDAAMIAQGDTLKSYLLEQPDNYDIPTHFMIGDDPGTITADKPAAILEAKMDEFKAFITAQLTPAQQAELEENLNTLNTDEIYNKRSESVV